MKKNYLYKAKLNYLNTQKGITIIQEELLNFLNNKLNLVKIRPPKYFHESESIFEKEDFSYSRKINFDSITDYSVYKLYNDYHNWMYGKIINLNIKNNNGIFTLCNYLIRDEQEFGIKTFEKNEIILFYRFENEELMEEKILNFLKLFFQAFRNLKKRLVFSFKELKEVLPNEIEILNLNSEEKAKLDKNNVLNLKSYFLQKNVWNIFIYNDSNNANSTYSMSTYLEKLRKYIDLIVIDFFSDSKITYFKVNIDLDLIYMFFLEKLFIYEVQANVNNGDIQKVLSENKITDI